ncbi:MAG: LysR family transcriptional regulator [Planctomycetaceae bacterium]|jgi:DNA-binding transcriptional LysR family regulator|nr:LysR family transcriptional regulator [Planctomycetaceae bacterium]
MNIATLRVFCDVVLHQSFSRGASANEVSQSAATQSINRLEKHLGSVLIDRGKRPFVLTPEGQICYEAFRDILEIYDNAAQLIKSPESNVRGQLRVAAIYSVGLNEMSRCMKEFMQTFPKSKVNLEYLHPSKIYTAVLNCEADLGIVSYPTASQEIDTIPLRSENMVLICPPAHPLAKRESVDVKELAEHEFIAFDRTLIIRKELDRYFRHYGQHVGISMEFDNIETIKQAVESGLGISIVPEPSVRHESQYGRIAARTLTPDVPKRPIGIIHRHRKMFTQTAKKFIEMISEGLGTPQ